MANLITSTWAMMRSPLCTSSCISFTPSWSNQRLLFERLGSYNPMVQENRFSIDAERAKYWLSVGAKPTDRVRKLMKLASIEGV